MTDLSIRFLESSEAGVLTDLVREAYGDTYDADWVYQPEEIARRITQGRLVSTVGLLDDEIVGHVALTREEAGSPVMHSGVAVVTEAARGQHLFTRLKQHAASWSKEQGVFGIFSEATAAHPYSQKANIDLNAHETGFLLGWIPASVANNAALVNEASNHRQSVALFYLKTNEAPDHPIYAPDRYQEIIAGIVETSGLRGKLASATGLKSPPPKTRYSITEKDDHNLSVITVSEVGDDLIDVAEAERNRLFSQVGRDAVYLDVPLNQPATEIVLSANSASSPFSFAGIFPNHQLNEDVLRLQSLAVSDIKSEDISTASSHGEALLEYVLEDLRSN